MADTWRRLRPYVNASLAVGITVGVVVLVALLGGRGITPLPHGAEQAADSVPVTEGEGQARSPWIVGGRPAQLASIVSFGGRTHACHGMMVDSQFVVTTAGCITKVKYYPVTIGRSDLDGQGGVTRKIADFRTNPKWDGKDPKSWAHDEAVVELDRPVENIKPVCLAAKGSLFLNGTRATVYGWGKVGQEEDLPAPRTLQAANVTIMDHGECKRIHRELTDDMICAVDDAGGPAICQGDAGAPLLVKVGDDLILLGSIIRGPDDCAELNSPGVYLTHNETFIKDAIKQMRDLTPCGIRNVPDVRVENGQVFAPHSSPWIGYIEDPNGRFWAGATLIHESFVVSNSYARAGDFVFLGAHDLSSTSEPTQRIEIEKVFTHPDSTSSNWPYLGMKLLKLAWPVRFTKTIRPICLPKPGYVLPAGSKCLFAGWGDNKVEPGSYLTDVPHEGSVTTITTDQCRQDWANRPWVKKWITKATICTTDFKNYPSYNDVGAPLSSEEKDSRINYLHGVLFMDSIPLHTFRRPCLFFDVSAHLPWINEVISAKASSNVCVKKFEG